MKRILLTALMLSFAATANAENKDLGILDVYNNAARHIFVECDDKESGSVVQLAARFVQNEDSQYVFELNKSTLNIITKNEDLNSYLTSSANLKKPLKVISQKEREKSNKDLILSSPLKGLGKDSFVTVNLTKKTLTYKIFEINEPAVLNGCIVSDTVFTGL
jgi:hypothetical protein